MIKDEDKNIENLIGQGFKPPCPNCSNPLSVGKKQNSEDTGAVGYTYRCKTDSCDFKAGFAYIPSHKVVVRAAQYKIVNILLGFISAITLSAVSLFIFGFDITKKKDLQNKDSETYEKSISQKLPELKENPTIGKSEKLVLYYRTLDDSSPRETVTRKADIDLYKKENQIFIRSSSKGDNEHSSWPTSGYYFKDKMALSYYESGGSDGLGTYFLKNISGLYVGHWLGLDYLQNTSTGITNVSITDCPCLISKKSISIEDAEQRWSFILDKKCQDRSDDFKIEKQLY